MNNVVTLSNTISRHHADATQERQNNVINLDEWRKEPHPIRTSHGVFFVSNVLISSGDAA